MATNTFQLGQPVLQNPGQLRLGQGGSQGGGSGPAPMLQQAGGNDGTFDALLKLGEAALAPAIEKQQSKMYLEGAQRVAQGESLKEIIDEQPWYTKIFGQSASVQGARTLAQVVAVDKYNASLLGDMDNLRKISPNEVGGIVNEKMQEFLTGDPLADAAIQQKMVEVSSTFYSTHAKQHYKYVQEEMRDQTVNMLVSSAGSLQLLAQQRAQGVISEKDWMLGQNNAAAALMPIDGQDPDSYWSGIETATVDALAQGNHHFVNLVFESGLIHNAPAEVRKKLIDERRVYENITREREGYFQFGTQIAELSAQARAGVIGPQEVAMRIDAMNQQFSASTGIESPLFTRDEMVGLVSGNMQKLYAKQEEIAKLNATARNDALAEEAKNQQLMQLVLGHGGGLATHLGFSASDRDTAVATTAARLRAENGDWVGFLAETYNKGDGYVTPLIQNQFQAPLRQASTGVYPGKSFDDAYELWKEMHARSPAAAAGYTGADNAIRMEKYDSYIQSGRVTPQEAFQLSFGQQLVRGIKPSSEEGAKLIESAVKQAEPGRFDKWFGGAYPLSESARKNIDFEVGKHIGDLTANLGINGPEAATRALEMTKGKIDIVGPWAIRRQPDALPLSALVGASDKGTADVLVKDVVDSLRARGLSPRIPGYDEKGILGALADGRSPTLREASRSTGIGFIMDSWNRIMNDEPEINIIPGPTQYDEDGKPFSILFINAVVDGEVATFTRDTRELRKKYEQSPTFSD